MVLFITPDEFQQMESAVLDADAAEALGFLKKFVKRRRLIGAAPADNLPNMVLKSPFSPGFHFATSLI